MSARKVLITGITGQDGSYLAELMLGRGYKVHGVVRRDALEDPTHRLTNIVGIQPRIQLHAANIDNSLSLHKIVSEVRPDQCYHFAASSFVSYAFDDENTILSHNFSATHYLLSALKELAPKCRLYFAGSSEMFGAPDAAPQTSAAISIRARSTAFPSWPVTISWPITAASMGCSPAPASPTTTNRRAAALSS
jgi:GDPmannose 4,6-dehydratase